MTKLSDVGVHEMRCWIVLSSSMLLPTSQHQKAGRGAGTEAFRGVPRTCTACG